MTVKVHDENCTDDSDNGCTYTVFMPQVSSMCTEIKIQGHMKLKPLTVQNRKVHTETAHT
jgi:hypothetical protein